MRIRIELDSDATDRLIEVAVAERRPVPLQAEVMLMRALGIEVPRSEPLSRPAEESTNKGEIGEPEAK